MRSSIARSVSSIGAARSQLCSQSYAQLLRIDDLADRAGMSASTSHRHSRAITTTTPVQYQKQVRLQEARVRLLSQQEDVAAVGFSVGYNSPSQFSREYSRFFGVPPGKDAARLRDVARANGE